MLQSSSISGVTRILERVKAGVEGVSPEEQAFGLPLDLDVITGP